MKFGASQHQQQTDRKPHSSSDSGGGSNWNLHTNVMVKPDKDQSRGKDNKNPNVRCYTCGELSHTKRNCPKGSIKKIEENSTGLYNVKASIGDSMYTCLLDTGADRTIILESQAQGLEVGETVDLHAAGHSFQGRATNAKVHVGPVTKEVRATIVPDRIISLPLIGVYRGERAVQTRQHLKKEAASKASAAKSRLKQQVRSVDPESITSTGNLPITNYLAVVEDIHELTDASERTDEVLTSISSADSEPDIDE